MLPWAVLVLLLGSASLLGGALVMSRTARRDIEQRVELVATAAGTKRAGAGANSRIEQWAGDMVRRIFTAGMPYRWGIHTKSIIVLAIAAAALIVTWSFFHVLLHFPLIVSGPFALIVAYAVPALLLRMEQAAADQKFLDGFPDAVDMIVRMLRAGLPVPATMRAVANEAAAPVNEIFRTVADRIDIGIPFEEALQIASEQVGIGDFRFFAAAVGLQRTTGGNLATTLEILCDIVRKRRAIRLKARAATAEVRISAYVLGALPFLVVGGLLLVAPQYLAPLIRDPRGNMIIATALLMLLMAFLVMREMMRRATKL